MQMKLHCIHRKKESMTIKWEIIVFGEQERKKIEEKGISLRDLKAMIKHTNTFIFRVPDREGYKRGEGEY